MTVLIIIGVYLALLITIGVVGGRSLRGTSADFFVASRSIGPFLMVMSLFGTTMTAFALVGSTGKAYTHGIGVYGLMASASGLVHSAVFLLIGVPVWRLGRRLGHRTQAELLSDRFESPAVGRALFPLLVGLVIPYLLIGLIGAGMTVAGVTRGGPFGPAGVPPALTSGVIALVVLAYVALGGLRAAAWANAFQTLVFMTVGILAFATIAGALGGPAAATAAADARLLDRSGTMSVPHFVSYMLVPLSVGMFPHLFQHWLTARSAKAFQAPVILHPLLIAIVWLPCVLLGVWASGALDVPPAQANAVLGILVARFADPLMSGLLTAGILAAVMSSLDSQFLCLGTMFTHDVLLPLVGEERLPDRRKVLAGRLFVAVIVLLTWALSLVTTRGIFGLGVWCFSGFAGLTPIMVAALYWRRATAMGALVSTVASGATWIALFWQTSGHGPGEPLILGVMPVTFIVLAGALGMIVGSLASAPPSAATLQRFGFGGGGAAPHLDHEQAA